MFSAGWSATAPPRSFARGRPPRSSRGRSERRRRGSRELSRSAGTPADESADEEQAARDTRVDLGPEALLARRLEEVADRALENSSQLVEEADCRKCHESRAAVMLAPVLA